MAVVKGGASQMTTFYLFLFRCVHISFENGHIVLNTHSKISEDNIVIFIADNIGNVVLGIIFLSDEIKTDGICQAK